MWLAAWLGIQVIFGLPQQCKDLNYIGCYYGGETKVYITKAKTNKPKELVVLHEVGHACGYKGEDNADQFADYWYSGKIRNKKYSREQEFILITRICKILIKDGKVPGR